MAYSLNNLKKPSKLSRKKKRVGRGNASGKGTYATRGLKGQRSRSGGRQGIAKRAAFQQLLIRTPKLRGFKRASAAIAIINLSVLDENFKDGDVVTSSVLIKKGLISKTKGGVKVLSNGTITKKLTVKLDYFSDSAKKAIQDAGGKCETPKKEAAEKNDSKKKDES
ncbi:50S ribosomal protein L15 [bacterium]|jgi:large subunit ribosomal protein L15|nr:50S ribosomal protein L15 [bacterium]MDP6571470.1 50S ribosomal protein L15 [Patescibacteria group bacterium]MDP6756469.1 50S ribosomal protein L15 [Patescibacteria group bacterium]|tara:strand:- start:1298 stop:1795 length:498 start_codon:yes stop_codon:yes gene_type:complete